MHILDARDSDTVYIKVDKSNLLEKGRDKNRKFIQKIKDDLNSTKLFFGHPQFKGNGYIKIVPGPPRSIRELVLIKENVRMGLYSFIIHYLNQGGLQNAYLCCSFLTRFDKSHYNHFVWFGKINKALGKNPEAKSSFEEALRICEGDKNWPRESMKNITALIRQEIESCT